MNDFREPRYQPYLLTVRERLAMSWAIAGFVAGTVAGITWALWHGL